MVTKDGLPLAFEVFEGSTHDTETLQQIVERIEAKYGPASGVWVVDRGMVSEENLQWLRQRQGQYLVGTPRSLLKNYEVALRDQADWAAVYEDVEVKAVPGPEGMETFLLCRSRARREKEAAIHRRFVQRLEQGLTAIQAAIDSRRLRDPEKIGRRIGALLQRNSRAAKAFEVKLTHDETGHLRLEWSQRSDWVDWAELSEGAYLLRTNLVNWKPEQLWKSYMQLTQVENAFRISKSDLEVRPIFHQTADRTRAHILVCFLAYVLWKTLEKLCEASGLGTSARTVLQELPTPGRCGCGIADAAGLAAEASVRGRTGRSTERASGSSGTQTPPSFAAPRQQRSGHVVKTSARKSLFSNENLAQLRNLG